MFGILQVLYMLGDIAAGPAYRFTQWLDLVRKRSATYGSSGFPHRLHRIDDMVTRLMNACVLAKLANKVSKLGPFFFTFWLLTEV